MKSDTVAIIPAHINNESKRKLLKQCLSNIPIERLISTNTFLDEELQNNCDYIIYDKKNPLLFSKDFEKYDVNFWVNIFHIDHLGNKTFSDKQLDYEHGFAAYTLIANGLKCAKAMGFKKCHVIEYDYEWNDEVISMANMELNEHDALFYRYNPHEWNGEAYNSSYFSGDIDALLYFFGKHSIDSYYRSKLPNHGSILFELMLYFGMKNSPYKIKEVPINYIREKLKEYNRSVGLV